MGTARFVERPEHRREARGDEAQLAALLFLRARPRNAILGKTGFDDAHG